MYDPFTVKSSVNVAEPPRIQQGAESVPGQFTVPPTIDPDNTTTEPAAMVLGQRVKAKIHG